MTSDKSRDENTTAMDDVERTIAYCAPRELPLEAARERAFRHLHSDWRQYLREKRRRTVTWLVGMAASVTLAAGLVFLIAPPPGPPAVPLAARVMDVVGNDTTVNGAPLVFGSDRGVTSILQIGDTLRTGDASMLGITWMQQDSLRVDRNSELTIADGNRIRLVRGRIYFAAPGPAGTRSDLVVETQLGTVSHVGTQFFAAFGTDGLQLAVREGKVLFAGGPHEFTVNSGTEVRVDREEKVSQGRISATDDQWAWTEDVAPAFDPDGRSTLELVNWISHETGLKVRFASLLARDRAASDRIVGLPPGGPRQMLVLLQSATDLDVQVDESEILVRVRP